MPEEKSPTIEAIYANIDTIHKLLSSIEGKASLYLKPELDANPPTVGGASVDGRAPIEIEFHGLVARITRLSNRF